MAQDGLRMTMHHAGTAEGLISMAPKWPSYKIRTTDSTVVFFKSKLTPKGSTSRIPEQDVVTTVSYED